MPKLWSETVGEHRRSVQDAIVEATADLVAEVGLLSVSMTQIAERAGIARATLYRYFPDVEAILRAEHRRHVHGHLERLAEVASQPGDAGARLEAVLRTYAVISHHRGQHAAADISALLHRGDDVIRAEKKLIDIFRDVLSDARDAGAVRDDVAPEELAVYCSHALAAAGELPTEAAAHRLVDVTLSALRPPITEVTI